MIHQFLVTVETDYTNLDAPDATAIGNEIQSNLDYDGHKTGIIGVDVVLVPSHGLTRLQAPHSEGRR